MIKMEQDRASDAARMIREAAAMMPPERAATAAALRALAASVLAGDRPEMVFLGLWMARARLGEAARAAASAAVVAGGLGAL